MRNDAVGFFWNDTPPPKATKEKVKRQPPDPVWLRADYLPGLEEALRFPAEIMDDNDLTVAMRERQEMVVDVECYINYFLVVFTNMVTGRIAFFEMYDGCPLDKHRLLWMLTTFTIDTFNGINYDLPIIHLALAGVSCSQLKAASDDIILMEMRGSDVRRKYMPKGAGKIAQVDHIDLIEVAPLFASLKGYAGRMHCPKMQDLPFHPSTVLTPEQRAIVRWYCVNDTYNTAYLRNLLNEQIELRYTLSNEYQVDLRSKSDAQIAEAVMAAELTRRTGIKPQKPTIEVGTTYRYNVPPFIKFTTPMMNWMLNVVTNARFVVDFTGSIAMPQEILALNLTINQSKYQMGIGGLHSCESTVAHYTDKDNVLIDKDVTSFYPFIILGQGLFPPHLGPVFLHVYNDIVQRRLAAKAAGNKPVAESLKIVINGSFGKFGSKYSILYAPHFLIQTTITGQLSILMLIERLELANIHVVSANTDGIVIMCPRNRQHVMDEIVAMWERDTNYQTEETRYLALYSRDVNNYIAVKQKFDKQAKAWIEIPDGIKSKGAYANPWSSNDNLAMRLHKNPTTTICVEAVENFLLRGIPVDHTILSERDIRKFVVVRSVKGGAVKVWDRVPPPLHDNKRQLLEMAGFYEFAKDSWIRKGESDRTAKHIDNAYEEAWQQLSKPGKTDYIGKSVRWYYAKDIAGELVYAGSGNKVPRSDGAMPCMVLPDTLPTDIDYDWYIAECGKILEAIGAIQAA